MQSHPTQPLSYATVIILTVLHKYAQIDFSKIRNFFNFIFLPSPKSISRLSIWDQLSFDAFYKIKHYTKMKFSIKDFSSKCDQIRTFPEEILNGKFYFLEYSETSHTSMVELFCKNTPMVWLPVIFLK